MISLKRRVAALEEISNPPPPFIFYHDQRTDGFWQPSDGAEHGFKVGGVVVDTTKEVEELSISQGWKCICYVEVLRA